jgi:hypothetical protein
MGTNVIAGNFIAFSVASLINLPGNARLRLDDHHRQAAGERADWSGGIPGLACVLAVDHYSDADCLGQRPFAGFIASFYTHEEDVKRW